MEGVIAYLLIVGVLFALPLWRIFARAGYSPKLSLLAFIPHIGILIVLLFLAFARWPITTSDAAASDQPTE